MGSGGSVRGKKCDLMHTDDRVLHCDQDMSNDGRGMLSSSGSLARQPNDPRSMSGYRLLIAWTKMRVISDVFAMCSSPSTGPQRIGAKGCSDPNGMVLV